MQNMFKDHDDNSEFDEDGRSSHWEGEEQKNDYDSQGPQDPVNKSLNNLKAQFTQSTGDNELIK